MNIYCFYIVGESLAIGEYCGLKADTIVSTDENEYSLYAFTPEKDISDIFKETRNMKLFYEKKISMSRDEYEEFCDEYDDYLIEYHLFKTKTIEKGVYCKKEIYMLCTKIESDLVLYYPEDYLINILLNDFNIQGLSGPIDLFFNDKITNALAKYFYYYEFANSTREFDSSELDIDIDQVALFIRLFSNTFVKG